MKQKNTRSFDQKIIRVTLLAILDILSVALATFLTLWFRFDLKSIPEGYVPTFTEYIIYDAAIVTIVFAAFGLYSSVWKYASITELISIALAVGVSDLLLFTYKHMLLLPSPRSFWLIFPIVLMILTCGIRFSYRIIRELINTIGYGRRNNTIMVIGAGDATRLLIDEMSRNEVYEDTRIACIIDDDVRKIGTRIRKIPVVGTRKDIEEMADKYLVTEIIIAIPSARKDNLARIVAECQKVGCEIKIIPAAYLDIDNGEDIARQIRPLQYEDFLGRGIADFVVEDDLGGVGGTIDELHLGFHAINHRSFVFEIEFDDGLKETFVVHHQVFQVVFPAEFLAGVFEVLGIVAMPHHAHRVHFAEADVETLGDR